jgi:hypothetical protein
MGTRQSVGKSTRTERHRSTQVVQHLVDTHTLTLTLYTASIASPGASMADDRWLSSLSSWDWSDSACSQESSKQQRHTFLVKSHANCIQICKVHWLTQHCQVTCSTTKHADKTTHLWVQPLVCIATGWQAQQESLIPHSTLSHYTCSQCCTSVCHLVDDPPLCVPSEPCAHCPPAQPAASSPVGLTPRTCLPVGGLWRLLLSGPRLRAPDGEESMHTLSQKVTA